MWGNAMIAATVACALIGCGDDDGAPRRCATDLLIDSELVLEPAGDPPQIHAAVGFDGRQLWLAYNLPDGEGDGGFDAFVRRFECDGTAIGDAVRMTTSAGGNDVDPALAVAGDSVGVAWVADTGAAQNNLDVLFRAVDLDGVPLTDGDVRLETSRAGNPVPGNVLLPALAALPDDEFALAAVRGLDETGSFQTFVQRLAGDGSLLGEAVDPAVEPGVGHGSPALAATDAGDLYLAWSRFPNNNDSFVAHTLLAAGTAAVDPSPPPELAVAADRASYAVGQGGAVFLAYQQPAGARDIVLMAGDRFAASAPEVSFGASGIDHSPVIAAGPGGGAVGYYRNISGFQNDYVLQPFSWDGSDFTLGAERVLPVGPVAPYAPAITYVQDGVYFVAWSEGDSPDFVLRGMFVQL